MAFLSLLLVASMPVMQLLIICFVGVILATKNINILSPSARRNLNKIVFTVFGPALIFGSLIKTITLQDLISWWFMPVNIGITFLVGGSLGWVAVKILKPKPHLEGLIVASCSAGNLGYMLLIIIPEVCSDEGSPFGDHKICTDMGLCYNALSMALGGFYIWTHTYSLMKKAGIKYEKTRIEEGLVKQSSVKMDSEETLPISSVVKAVIQAEENQIIVPLLAGESINCKPLKIQEKLKETIHLFVEELTTAPTIAAVLGFIVGVVPWLKGLIIGGAAPFRVIEDSITLLGQGTIPCNILVLGANLTNGMRKSVLAPSAIIAIILVKYIAAPCVGIVVVKSASHFGFLPQDPLYQYVLLLQFALPPATAIGTMAELFNVGQQEYSVIFLWTYLVAALALTFWSTTFMYILT